MAGLPGIITRYHSSQFAVTGPMTEMAYFLSYCSIQPAGSVRLSGFEGVELADGYGGGEDMIDVEKREIGRL